VAQGTIHVLIGDAIRGALVFYCANLAVVGSDQISDGNRLLGALVGTIALASLGQLVLQPLPQLFGRSQLQDLRRLLLDFLATCLPLSILAFAVPTSVNFGCEPMVPWNIWTGIFGAFPTSFMGTATARPGAAAYLGLMTLLALFWIGPFVGFFYAPWFLAQVLILPCDSRSQVQSILVTVPMISAIAAGYAVARWLYERRQ